MLQGVFKRTIPNAICGKNPLKFIFLEIELRDFFKLKDLANIWKETKKKRIFERLFFWKYDKKLQKIINCKMQ